MAKVTEKLTQSQCERAKPKEKDYKLTRLEERLNKYERERNERNSEVSV